MPSRRACLTTFAAAGLAGCMDNSSGSVTDSPTDTATTTPGTPPRPAVDIEAAAVQYAYRHIENVDWNAVRTAGGQFVFVTLDATEVEPAPGREAFSLVTADERYDPVAIERRSPVDLDVPGKPYMSQRGDADPRGWLVFDVPARLDGVPSLRLDRDDGSREWGLDPEKATAPPPAWEWAVDAPETVRPDGTFDIVVSVENVGDGPGTFRGAVNFSYPLYKPEGFDIQLEPGQSGEARISARSENADPGSELTYDVRTPVDESEVTVTVEAAPTSTESTNYSSP